MRKDEIKKHKEIVECIYTEITENGLYSKSKNDIYDFLLYTFDKYNNGNFFMNKKDSECERKFKITSIKVKNARKNISVKFMDNKEYENIFIDFFR